MLPASAAVTRAMRWWSLIVLGAAVFVCAREDNRVDGLMNFRWLYASAILTLPLMPLWLVANNRPPPRVEEIQRIAVRMALSDQVYVRGAGVPGDPVLKKCWMIAGQPVDPESEEGQKWLYVAMTAHLGDAILEYNRRWGRDAASSVKAPYYRRPPAPSLDAEQAQQLIRVASDERLRFELPTPGLGIIGRQSAIVRFARSRVDSLPLFRRSVRQHPHLFAA